MQLAHSFIHTHPYRTDRYYGSHMDTGRYVRNIKYVMNLDLRPSTEQGYTLRNAFTSSAFEVNVSQITPVGQEIYAAIKVSSTYTHARTNAHTRIHTHTHAYTHEYTRYIISKPYSLIIYYLFTIFGISGTKIE